MEDPSFFDRMISHLRATCMHYTGYPKDLGPSQVIHFTSEREFVNLLHEGFPVVVAFTIRGNYTRHLDKVLEESAAEFYPNVKFMRVECPKYPGFCITRQKKEYPFVEIFHSPTHVWLIFSVQYHDLITSLLIQLGELGKTNNNRTNQGRVADPNITKYNVKVLPFNYDVSAYGFREFFKRHGIRASDPK
ncbi:hypothetical protein JHK85_006923 [Glycine max]|nr:hypothetical protein JHK85_006923 [Glycine max]